MATSDGSPRGALVLGADYRALGVARSLGRRGVPVWLLSASGKSFPSLSRYVRRTLRWPDCDEDAQADFLRELAVSGGLSGFALIPSDDHTAALLARRHEDLARYYFHTISPWEKVRWTYDKRLTYELADRVGVAYPRTTKQGAASTIDAIDIPFPAVLKPAIKDVPNALTIAKAWPVQDREELTQRFVDATKLVAPDLLMVQEFVPGAGEMQYSYAALCSDGVPLTSLTARRTRQYPAQIGRASTYVETVACPDLTEPSVRLLGELGYTGLIEIEYKRDPRDGVFKLLDMNPRVWGWHTLCSRAGVDFSWLLWLLISGRDVPSPAAQPGIGWLRFSTDTPTAIRELLGGRLTAREYARSLRRPRESAIFAWDDPLPALAEIPFMAYILASRLLRGEPI